MEEWVKLQTASGSLALALPVAALAGLVSFFSPCVIPLLPGYLSYATGLTGSDLAHGEASRRRGRMVLGSFLFVMGFTVVFVVYGTALGALRSWLRQYREEIVFGMGLALIALGVVFAGVVPGLQREWRIHAVPFVGLGAAPLIGALFAIGWTPCIGPTYSVIVGLTYDDSSAARGAILSGAYALGLGVPFIVTGIFYARSLHALRWVRSHQLAVMRIGGAVVVVVGILLVTDRYDFVTQWVQVRLARSNPNWFI